MTTEPWPLPEPNEIQREAACDVAAKIRAAPSVQAGAEIVLALVDTIGKVIVMHKGSSMGPTEIQGNFEGLSISLVRDPPGPACRFTPREAPHPGDETR